MSENNRTGVRTYIPEYQKEEWQHHADELNMSLSEFIRVMVQAGRRGFVEESGRSNDTNRRPEETEDNLEPRILEILDSEGPLDWDGLVEGLTGDFEDRLEEALDELQSSNRVKYSGRKGGYVIDG
jgi:hypothetical protein